MARGGFEASWAASGASLGLLGAAFVLLGRQLGQLAAVLGSIWGNLWLSWGGFGPSWAASWAASRSRAEACSHHGRQDAAQDALKPPRATGKLALLPHLGAAFVLLGRHLGQCAAVLGGIWGYPGPSWGGLCPSWAASPELLNGCLTECLTGCLNCLTHLRGLHRSCLTAA